MGLYHRIVYFEIFIRLLYKQMTRYYKPVNLCTLRPDIIISLIYACIWFNFHQILSSAWIRLGIYRYCVLAFLKKETIIANYESTPVVSNYILQVSFPSALFHFSHLFFYNRVTRKKIKMKYIFFFIVPKRGMEIYI